MESSFIFILYTQPNRISFKLLTFFQPTPHPHLSRHQSKPLFVAPIGRTYEKFKEESLAHGWPSFRPEETVAENVIIHFGGRMESVCGTHLGHNLPDWSGPRYCIGKSGCQHRDFSFPVSLSLPVLSMSPAVFLLRVAFLFH